VLFFPLIALRGRIGFISIPGALEKPISPAERQQAEAMLGPAAVAIERIWLSQEHELSSLAAETERMINALLISVSHDLKTPLDHDNWFAFDHRISGNLKQRQQPNGNGFPCTYGGTATRPFHNKPARYDKVELGGLSVTLCPTNVQDVVTSVLQRAQPLLQDHRTPSKFKTLFRRQSLISTCLNRRYLTSSIMLRNILRSIL